MLPMGFVWQLARISVLVTISRRANKELAVLATAMKGGKGQDSAEQFLANMEALIRDFEFPPRPSDLGVKKEDAQIILEKTLIQTRRIQTNPRQLDEDLLSFIEEGI